jgi:hypothetical protein
LDCTTSQQGARGNAAQMIFLGVAAAARLGESVLLAEVVTKSYFVDLSSYPRWLVILVGTLVLALVVWIGMKLLKVALWVLFFLVLVGGIAWAGWELIH